MPDAWRTNEVGTERLDRQSPIVTNPTSRFFPEILDGVSSRSILTPRSAAHKCMHAPVARFGMLCLGFSSRSTRSARNTVDYLYMKNPAGGAKAKRQRIWA